MTKLFSLIAFIAAFIWTWFLFKPTDKLTTSAHAGIQSSFIQLIQSSIKNIRPLSSNFQVIRIYTEKIDDNKVTAHFSYKYTDQLDDKEGVEQQLSGTAVITRGLSEDPNQDKWVLQSMKTDNPKIEFQQGVVVNPTEEKTQPADKPTN